MTEQPPAAPRVRLDHDRALAVLRLDHPPVNAFDDALRDELAVAVTGLHAAPDVRAVVIHGGDRLFAAGADIARLAQLDHAEVVHWNRLLQRTFDAVAQLPMPVVAVITGVALGGGLELALAADYRIAADNSRVGLPEVQLGIMPGSGGTQRLARLVGPSRAKHLAMTGRTLTAAEAHTWGIVDEVVPAAHTLARALEYAAQLARGPAQAIASIKSAIDHGLDASLTSGLALERSLLAGTFASPDRTTGMTSFLEHGPGKADFTR